MKKILYLVPFLLLPVSVQATDITWADKTTGGTFTAADANAVKTAVNSKADSAEAMRQWVDEKPYLLGDIVYNNGKFYKCSEAHLASPITEPGVGVSWASGWTVEPLTIAASGVSVVATGFNGNLATTDDTVQEALRKFDDLVVTGVAANNTAYNITSWDTNTDSATKNVLRDYLINFDTDGDGSFLDETWLLNLFNNISYIADTNADLSIRLLEVTAGSFVSGQKYEIETPGTTNFTLIGAADSLAGTIFIASGVGSGTGTANHIPPLVTATPTDEDKQALTANAIDTRIAAGSGQTKTLTFNNADLDTLNSGSVYPIFVSDNLAWTAVESSCDGAATSLVITMETSTTRNGTYAAISGGTAGVVDPDGTTTLTSWANLSAGSWIRARVSTANTGAATSCGVGFTMTVQ